MDIVINQNVEINNPELKKVTNEIRKSSANVIANTFKIASLIAKVDNEELFVDDGFENVFAYTKACFGLEKTSTYNLIKVGNDFIEAVKSGNTTTFATLLTHGDKDYSISQVFKMLPLGIDKAKELTADGVINETMSCRQIEKIVKENTDGTKARGKKKTDDTEPDENNDVTDETEDEVVICEWDEIPDEVKMWFMEKFDFSDFDEIREIDIR